MTTDTIRIQDAEYDLEGLETLAWELLTRGSQSGRDPLHTGVMCSTGRDGTPDGRTMVLRQVDSQRRLLASYSDVRAPKVRALQEHPGVAWIFYDPRRRLEVRAAGRMRVFTGPGDRLAESMWASMSASAQHAYAGAEASGLRQVLRTPDAAYPTAAEVGAQSARNFGNFAVLLTFVEKLELLYLHHGGHHRARFCYRDEALVERHWVST